jgi:hypothetical protein
MRPRGSRSPRDRGGRQCSCLHQHMCPVHKACSPLRRRPRISPLGTRRKWMQPWRRAQRMRCPRRTTYTRKDQWRPRSFLCCKQSSWRWPPCWADTCQEDTGCKRARHWCSHTCPGCKRGRRGRNHPRSCLRTPWRRSPHPSRNCSCANCPRCCSHTPGSSAASSRMCNRSATSSRFGCSRNCCPSSSRPRHCAGRRCCSSSDRALRVSCRPRRPQQRRRARRLRRRPAPQAAAAARRRPPPLRAAPPAPTPHFL